MAKIFKSVGATLSALKQAPIDGARDVIFNKQHRQMERSDGYTLDRNRLSPLAAMARTNPRPG